MFYLGVDLGGTNISVGLVDDEGRILRQKSRPTLPERGAEAVANDMAEIGLELVEEQGCALADVKAIGVGVPGIADANGNVIFCTNLGWINVPLQKLIRSKLDIPVFVDNDATVAGLAEAVAGVSKGYKNSVFITLGTGIGGGLFADGRVYVGAHRAAGEIGHMIIEAGGEPCTCGNEGCWERYASATALIRMGAQAMEKDHDSLIYVNTGGDPAKVTGRIVIDAARQGDKTAVQVFDNYVHYLSLGLTSIIHFFDPDIIALGGGISGAGDFLIEPVRKEVAQHVIFKDVPHARIEIAALRNDAGIIGAAMLGR